MAEIDPPMGTAPITPPASANAVKESRPYVSGVRSASAVAPPSPGMAPKKSPMVMPRARNRSSRACSKPPSPLSHRYSIDLLRVRRFRAAPLRSRFCKDLFPLAEKCRALTNARRREIRRIGRQIYVEFFREPDRARIGHGFGEGRGQGGFDSGGQAGRRAHQAVEQNPAQLRFGQRGGIGDTGETA